MPTSGAARQILQQFQGLSFVQQTRLRCRDGSALHRETVVCNITWAIVPAAVLCACLQAHTAPGCDPCETARQGFRTSRRPSSPSNMRTGRGCPPPVAPAANPPRLHHTQARPSACIVRHQQLTGDYDKLSAPRTLPSCEPYPPGQALSDSAHAEDCRLHKVPRTCCSLGTCCLAAADPRHTYMQQHTRRPTRPRTQAAACQAAEPTLQRRAEVVGRQRRPHVAGQLLKPQPPRIAGGDCLWVRPAQLQEMQTG